MAKIFPYQILLPVGLTAFVLFCLLAFQTSQILLERASLRQTKTKQDAPLEDAVKLQAQFSALAIGTKNLATNGDKNAIVIINLLNQIGVGFTELPSATAINKTSSVVSPSAAAAAKSNLTNTNNQ